jgi:signal transduction histidine kinase
MDWTPTADEQLTRLASHLSSRRTTILKAWRLAVDNDRELTAPSSLPRTQFNDHIPELLDAFEKRLQVWPRSESAASGQQRKEGAASHGLQRWQQGYRLREVTREWGHLNSCLVDELANYSIANPDLEPRVMPTAWRALAELCSQGVSESTTQYFQLEKVEAAGHVRDMEQTLAEVRELERRRTELFRQAAHDLRGNVGVVRNVTDGLTQDGVPETMRDEFLVLLERSVSSLNSMLDEVMDLARLQAGHELRNVKPFDATVLLRDLFDNLQPLATERRLFLKADGPETLTLEGDAVKIRRIAQNLLLNALKYTSDGGVTIAWGDSRNNDPKRWMLSVEDTGPGIHAGPGAPMVEALQGATTDSREVDQNLSNRGQGSPPDDAVVSVAVPRPSPDPRPVHQSRGEGIGLSIVKRLCELLDASIEVESTPGEGTTFRVILPRHYNASEQKQ